MSKLVIKSIAAALVLAGLTGSAFAADAPIVIKFSHVVADNTPKGQAARLFAQLADKYTNHQVKVEVYPNSTLYKDKEEMDALQLGAVQMLAPSLAKFGPLGVKEFELFDLPYLFDDYASLNRITQGAIGRELFQKLEAKGVRGLAYWDNGFKVMSANKPLHVPADVKGLKMRIQSSKVLDAEMRALGANPQVTPLSEAYTALQTGVVDGTENPPSNLYTQKMHEVQKYVTVTNHGYLGYAVIVNKQFWDSLPASVRPGIDRAMAESTAFANSVAKKDNDDALDAVRKSGKTTVITLTPQEKSAWSAALLPVQQQMASRIGPDLVARAVKTASGK